MEIIVDIFIELYIELMFLIVPREKVTKKRQVFAAIIACVVLLGVITAFVIGGGLIVEGDIWKGCLLVGASIFISLVQIVAGIILYCRKNRR